MSDTYTSIKSLAPKPSDAIQAMIDGLLKASKRDDFHIDFSTFGAMVEAGHLPITERGDLKGRICVGCAATCTLQEVAQKDFKISDFPKNKWGDSVNSIMDTQNRAEYLGLDPEEVSKFEYAIDTLRLGGTSCFISFYADEFGLDFDFNPHKDASSYYNPPAEAREIDKLIRIGLNGPAGLQDFPHLEGHTIKYPKWKRNLPKWKRLVKVLKAKGF